MMVTCELPQDLVLERARRDPLPVPGVTSKHCLRRRLRAAGMFGRGKSQAEVAHALGVSAQSVAGMFERPDERGMLAFGHDIYR